MSPANSICPGPSALPLCHSFLLAFLPSLIHTILPSFFFFLLGIYSSINGVHAQILTHFDPQFGFLASPSSKDLLIYHLFYSFFHCDFLHLLLSHFFSLAFFNFPGALVWPQPLPHLTPCHLCLFRGSLTCLLRYLLFFDSPMAFRVRLTTTLDSWPSITQLLALPSFLWLSMPPLMFFWTSHPLLFLPHY